MVDLMFHEESTIFHSCFILIIHRMLWGAAG